MYANVGGGPKALKAKDTAAFRINERLATILECFIYQSALSTSS
jgi:hypothetical protein